MDGRCGLFDGIAVLHGKISVGSDDIPEATIDFEPNKIILKRLKEHERENRIVSADGKGVKRGILRDIFGVERV